MELSVFSSKYNNNILNVCVYKFFQNPSHRPPVAIQHIGLFFAGFAKISSRLWRHSPPNYYYCQPCSGPLCYYCFASLKSSPATDAVPPRPGHRLRCCRQSLRWRRKVYPIWSCRHVDTFFYYPRRIVLSPQVPCLIPSKTFVLRPRVFVKLGVSVSPCGKIRSKRC